MSKFLKHILAFYLVLGLAGFSPQVVAQDFSGTQKLLIDDDDFEHFIAKYPQVQVRVKGHLNQNQKLSMVEGVFKEILETYEADFLKNTGLKAIIIHENKADYCIENPAIANCKTPGGGWAPMAGGILHIVAIEKSAVAGLGALVGGPQSCGQEGAAAVKCLNQRSLYNTEMENLKEAVHHELFHSFDKIGDLGPWQRLSPAGWTEAHLSGSAMFDEKIEGFVSTYAASSVVEDRAETYAHMILTPDLVLAKAKHDTYLKSKILEIKSYLESFCEAQSCKLPEAFLGVGSLLSK